MGTVRRGWPWTGNWQHARGPRGASWAGRAGQRQPQPDSLTTQRAVAELPACGGVTWLPGAGEAGTAWWSWLWLPRGPEQRFPRSSRAL